MIIKHQTNLTLVVMLLMSFHVVRVLSNIEPALYKNQCCCKM